MKYLIVKEIEALTISEAIKNEAKGIVVEISQKVSGPTADPIGFMA